MKVLLYPLAASKILRHCEIFLNTMKANESDELVELAFNEFVTSADRTIQYLHKEVNSIGGCAPNWFLNKRNNLTNRPIFYELRHIIAHHFFVPLNTKITIKAIHPNKEIQIREYYLDLEMMHKDKGFDKKKKKFIKELGSSIDAIVLCDDFYKDLSTFVTEAEQKYGNFKYFKRNKIKSRISLNEDLTLAHDEKQF